MSFAVTDMNDIPRDNEQNPFTLQMKDPSFFPPTNYSSSQELPYNNNRGNYSYNIGFSGNVLPWLVFLLTFGLVFGLLYMYAEDIDFSGVKDDTSEPSKIGIVFGWTLLILFLLSFLVWPLLLVPMVMGIAWTTRQEMDMMQNNNMSFNHQMQKPKYI